MIFGLAVILPALAQNEFRAYLCFGLATNAHIDMNLGFHLFALLCQPTFTHMREMDLGLDAFNSISSILNQLLSNVVFLLVLTFASADREQKVRKRGPRRAFSEAREP